ncbi:ATP-binding cassette sub-family A member 13 [Numida meleagris]|uniref:ATP-binding cassette sub-family A member 13 n=1 Tax=Numida meleagris TaxID=8996 RepID=UPI000B3DDAF5|nr:ATP-binding cassette sub-family A member 13 [Numida meleagris]
MGHTLRQFKALFWKNWLCRVRQPVLSLSEILWPCMLFLILAAVRFQEPPKHKENCYLEARDLPSRGLYPFMRTLFCNVGSRCRNTSYSTQKYNRLRNLQMNSACSKSESFCITVTGHSTWFDSPILGILICKEVLSLSEILWPCMLFLILAAVRFQEPPKHKENCYLEARDLPSRGLYPFMRTLFCNVGSRCRNTSYSTQKYNRLRNLQMNSACSKSESFCITVTGHSTWFDSPILGILICKEMDLNEAEEIISKVENLYKQPSFWNLLHLLPRLESKNLYTEDGLAAIAQFLEVIKNTLVSLKDLAVMPLGQSFHEVVKIALNLTAASVQERSLKGFQYNLSLENILWNPRAVRAELQSRFGFDDLHVKKLLSYTTQLTKIPTGETLEQFVCSALSSVPGDEANKENNDESCISPWQEAKLYLIHAVSKLRLYAQVFEQWFSSSHSQNLLSELERIIADLMSQLLEDREARKIVSEISTLIQQWDKKSEAYFSEEYTSPHDLILYLQKMQAVLQAVPQWSVVKRLRLVDGAMRNVISQYLNFTDEALRSLEKLIPFTQRNESIHLDIKKLFVELKQMLMSNTPYVCADVFTMLGKTLRHPQGSDTTDNLAIYMCTGNDSEVAFKQSNQLHSLRQAVLLLQKITQGQQYLPDSITDDYLGWQEIEEELAENYAYYCETDQLLSTEERVHFSSCEEQLLFSLINITLEEFFFTFEENPYWKYVTPFVRWTCEVAQYTDEEAGSTGGHLGGFEASLCSRQKLSLETILGHYLLVLLQDLPDYSSLISWAWNLTYMREFLKTEEKLWISSEKELDHILHLAEIIEEIIMFDFSALSSPQSLMETALGKVIMWMKGKESTTNVSLAVSELYNEIQKNLQVHLRFWMKEKTDFFWQMVKTVSHELDSRVSHVSQVEVEEVLESLSRFIFSVTENKKSLNRSMLLLKNILTDWQDLNSAALNHLKYLSENFLRNLYEIISLADSYVNASFSTGHGVSNTSFSLLSNATFIYKVQELGKIVPNFFKDIQKLNSSSVDSLLQILFSLYQNADLLLNTESNNTLMFLYNTSKDISSFQAWNDFQDMDQVSDFLFETFDLLWNFTSKSLCEKLLTFYNYTEFQAWSFAQEGNKELQVVYNILSSLNTLFSDEDLETTAFCYLEQFFDISPKCIVNNRCIGFYLSNITSLDHSAEVYDLLLLPLDSVLFNITKLQDKVSVSSALHCTFTWLQTWTKIFEETSKILNLNSTFFVYLRNDLTSLSESILNTTHVELCNKTTLAIVEATSAMNLLKIIVEGGDSRDWKDFETYLAIIQSVFENAVDVASSLKGNSSDDVLEMIEVVIPELQQSILKVANRDFLNSWLNTFTSGGPEGERGPSEFSILNSLSSILKLSPKELEFVLAEIKDIAAFLTYAPQDKYLVCASIFQNITKLIYDSTLKNISYSQVNFSSHIHSFLKSYSIIDGVEDCDGWVHGLHNLSEKYKSPSHLENAKHILFLLKSLGNIETDAKLKNTVDFINLIFNLMIPECSVTGSDVICLKIYFNIIAKTLRVILPEFNVQDDTNVLDYIFTLLNNSGGLIQMAVNNLMGHSQYTSHDTRFDHSVHGSNRTLKMFLNSFHSVLLSSIELLSEIQSLLKDKIFDMQESTSSPLDIRIDEKNISLLIEIFQAVISKLNKLNSNFPHELQGEYNTFLERLIEKATLNGKLVGKALKIFKSSSLTSFRIRDDREFLEHMITFVQNLKNMDIEFLIGQFKQVQRSLDNFFKNIKPLHIESSELGMLINWWDAFENNSCNGNLTGLWQITQLFQEEDLSGVKEMFHLLLDVISLTERLAHGNITEALAEVYTFVLTQEAKMPVFPKEISNHVESLLILLETLTHMPDEPAEASICFSAEFCWILKTVTPQSDLTSKPCEFMQSNFSLNHSAALHVMKELKLVTLNGSFLCTMEDFQTDITHNLTCFFHQIKEWNSILLKFSELRHINGSLLKELLAFWNELYLYAVPLQANNTNSTVNCFSTSKRKVALQIIETLSSMPVAEMEMAEDILEQLNNLYGGLSWNSHSRISLMETAFPYVKSMTSEVSGFLDTEAVYSFLSIVQPLMTPSSVGNQTYLVLMVLSSLSGNNNISDNIENIWFPVAKSIEDLLLNFNVRQALAVIDQEFKLLRLATGQSSSVTLDVLTQQFNTSSVEAVLRKFEDIQEIMKSFLCECNNQNYSKMMQPLVLLMANEKSSDLLLVVKDIIDFLELFQNKSEEDYTGMLLVDDHLSREILNNTYFANSVFQNFIFHMLAGLAVTEEALYANDTERQIAGFIDSFFDNAQYENVSTLSQNKTLEIMQEILQIAFPYFTEHNRNKITLVKDLRKDIMAEMRASKICQILQKHLHPASVLLLHKLQFAILNILKIFSEEPLVTSNLLCVVTKCKEGIMHHLVISTIEGITLVQDHYQSIERMWLTFNKGDCESMAYINLKLSSNLESFLRILHNITDGSCDCQLMLENIQRRLQKLIENWEIRFSENPVVAFLSNFNLLNDMKIKDYVQNITELRLDILSSVNLSEETISSILEASISFSKVFYSVSVVAFTQRCDEEVLSLLLKLPKNSKTSLAVEELCSLPALDLYTTFVLILQNLNLRHIIYMNKIPSDMGNVLSTLLDVVSSISSLLNKVQHVMENLPVFFQAIQNIGMFDISALQQFLQGGQFRSSTVGSLESVIKAVCKEESSFFNSANLFVDMPRITGLLDDNMAKYGIPEDSTPFCLKLYQEILQSSNGALVWTFLKPLLHGKILYNSNISMIDLVIEKANFTFGFVENLKTYSQAWLRMSEVFKNRGNVLMVSRLQEALQNNFVKRFVESNLDIDLEKLFQKMQVYEIMMGKTLNSSASRQIELLSQLIVNISSCVLLDRFQPFESVAKLEEKAHELMQQNNFLASIIFNTSKNKTPDSSNLLTQHVSYTIRTSVLYSMRTDLIKNPAWKSHPQKLPSDGFKYNHIFIPLQDVIERAIISAQTGLDISEPAIQVQAMPYPCHTSDLFLNNIGFFFPLMMMLTWMVSVASMVRKLVYEREIHLEEYMKTMGVHPAIHFFAWFLENVIVLTISSCALAIILKASGIFAYSNGFLIFLFLLDFGVTVIMLSYFLGVFFNSANTAALCASLVYMISFLPFIVLLVLQNQLSFTKQIIMCLLSTTAFGQGVFFITFFEGQEIGIQWNNMYQPMVQGGYMTFGCTCWMMFFDSILYSIGGWYFSNIILGKNGLRNCWYFPFTVSYWRNLCGSERMRKHYLNSNMFLFNENFQEKDLAPPGWKGTCTEGATIGVVLLSLTKEHMDNHKVAVKDLSLTFHKGQITALLGPNGAGKTTVISLLTGLYPPSSGTILINGKDIRTDLAAIRTELGVCPQYDVLFNILTVREHLLFYGSVKAPGWTNKQLSQQVSGVLEDVDLSQHQYKPVGALSGGMKRRLSIAISFIGNSKTVVLDEPTSGVDPCSRRSIWDVLLKYKAGCTLIFTTHHLDEAEVLSDRIAILQQGQLRCCGSPSYLRETYGQGHSLTLTKKPSVFEIQDPKHVVRVTSLVQTHIPEAFLKENSGTELTYVIPERADKTSFKGLLQALDQSLHHLHMTGYGISDTTLEEVLLVFFVMVFLKLLQDSEKSFVPQGPHLNNAKDAESAYISFMDASRVCGTNLILAQIVALLLKRFHHIRRDWRGSLSNVLLPVLFVALAMALFSVKPLAIDYPSLKLTPRLHNNAESFFSIEDDNLGNLSQILLRYFFDWDFTCMHSKQGKNNSCWQMESNSLLDSCGCMSAQEICPSFNTSVPYVKNKRGRILYNLSGLIVEEYLVRPSNKARYGGWSFGGKKASEYQEQKRNNVKSKPLVKVWYNQKSFHSLPSYLNELNNFILWLNLPPTVDWRQYGITLYSQPYGGALLDEDKIMENVRQCGVALCIMLGFSILTASIGSAIVKDRVSGTKRLQHITGLGYKTYWLANFCCDMLFYMLPVTLCVGVISAFQLSAFTFRNNLAATVILLVLFGYATLPWMYLVSRFFSSSDVAFISYISLNFVFGLCTMLVTLLPRLLAIISKVQSFQNIYKILKWAFIVFPQFCLGQGLIELSYNQIKFDLTSKFGIDSYVSPFEMNFLGWIFVEMALQGTVLLLLRLFFHWDLLQKQSGHCSVNSMVNPSEDTDVEMERQRLFGGRTGNDVLLLYNLRKCYGGFSKKNTAVENISLGVTRGECFGLLGTNGAGKSTTFKMLTGDIVPSAGRAVIRTPTGSEMDIQSASSEGILIGYCPQQDALDELLTGWEHLYYYCTLRGIPKQHICKVAEDLVNRLQLNAHADKLVRTYSAGTKRKLSAALALVGKPQILLLDEPSSGMDPCSKRYLWKTILKEVQDGCAAVLTSHSMEECEALCTRLAIMVNGSFKCLGSPQHIKNRFGDGYSVKVWLSKDISYQRMILDCLKLHFPGAQFKGHHLNVLEYLVPRSEGCLAELFRVLENYKALLQIKHYSISQTTLEQVFINFATQQQGISHSSQESPPVRQDHLPV